MAANKKFLVETHETQGEYIHEIEYSFTLENYLTREPFVFQQSYKSKCRKLRTKWKILMEFEKMNASENVSCILNIKRMDSRSGSVNVTFSMTLLNDSLHTLGEIIKHSTTGVKRGQEITKVFNPLVSTEDLCRLENEKVNILFCLGISGCHQMGKHKIATIGDHGPIIWLSSKI